MLRQQLAAVSLALAIAAAATNVDVASAQATAPGRVPTVSRLVVEFTQRETELLARLRAQDSQGAARLVTDDFELRASTQPGRPVPRADWLRQSLRSPGLAGTPTQMAVHDLGDTAVVSFLQAGAGASFFVVDAWRRVGGDWKLAIRYIAPSRSGGAPLPGLPPPEPEIPKKY